MIRCLNFIKIGFALSLLTAMVEVLRNGFLSWTVLLLFANVCMLLVAVQLARKFKHNLATALAADKSSDNESTLFRSLERAREMERETVVAISATSNIGQEEFPALIASLSNQQIKQSLLDTHSKISLLRKNEREDNWVTLGVAAITGLKHKGNDIADYTQQVISHVVKYLHANQGSLFMLQENQGEQYFELSSSYAYGKKKHLNCRVNLGEGLIGQIFYEKEVILLTEVPKNYVKITSGLGEALPRCICIVPLLSEEKVYGAIEVASFEKLQAFEVEYLKRVGEIVGETLMAIETHVRTEKLLSESQHMSQELKSQEEELRQNMEELKATQEAMLREQQRLETLSLVADHTNNSVLITDASKKIIYANEGFIKLTGYTFEEVVGKKPGDFLQGPLTDAATVARISQKLKTGLPFYEEILNYNKKGEIYWISLVVNPIKDNTGRIIKYVSIQSNITDTKKASLENSAKLESIARANAMLEFDAEGCILGGNDLFYKVTGYQHDMLVGKSYKILFPSNTKDFEQTELMWANILLGQVFSGEFKMADCRGDIQWLSGNYNPVYGIDGKIEKIIMLAQFTTQAKEKVIELQDTIQTIKNCYPMVELDENLGFKNANELFLSISGIKRFDLKRTRTNEVFPGASFDKIKHYFHTENENPANIDLLLLERGGQAKQLVATVTKLKSAQYVNRGLIIVHSVKEQYVNA
jgi:methyl-accepting chemotaxis protein